MPSWSTDNIDRSSYGHFSCRNTSKGSFKGEFWGPFKEGFGLLFGCDKGGQERFRVDMISWDLEPTQGQPTQTNFA